jgi:hypothetical protein
MMDIFDTTTANTNAITSMDDAEIADLRLRFCNATKSDRARVKKMLNDVMVEIREATNNETHIGTRVSRDIVTFLNDASSQYSTTPAALIRDAVTHYIQHELPKRTAPKDANEISLCE